MMLPISAVATITKKYQIETFEQGGRETLCYNTILFIFYPVQTIAFAFTYDVANISGGNHDEEEDGPDNFSPHRHVKWVHICTLHIMMMMMMIMMIMMIMILMMIMMGHGDNQGDDQCKNIDDYCHVKCALDLTIEYGYREYVGCP